VVTHQLQVERRTGKVRRSKTNVLPPRIKQPFIIKVIIVPHCHIAYEVGTLAVDGRVVTFVTARRGPRRPLLAVPNVTAHPSTASVPITVLMITASFCAVSRAH